MPNLINTETGALEPIPDELANLALSSGKYTVPPVEASPASDYVTRGAGGEAIALPGESLQARGLAAAGIESSLTPGDVAHEANVRAYEEELQGFGGKAAAAAGGFVRGASFGLLGQPTNEYEEDVERLNPGSALVGELGAMAVPGGPFSELSAGVREGLGVAKATGVARIAKEAAAAGIEMGAYSTGNQVGGWAWNDTPISGEAIVTDIGLGALIGGGVGSITELAGGAARRSAARAERAAKVDDIKEFVSGSGRLHTEVKDAIAGHYGTLDAATTDLVERAGLAKKFEKGFGYAGDVSAIEKAATKVEESRKAFLKELGGGSVDDAIPRLSELKGSKKIGQALERGAEWRDAIDDLQEALFPSAREGARVAEEAAPMWDEAVRGSPGTAREVPLYEDGTAAGKRGAQGTPRKGPSLTGPEVAKISPEDHADLMRLLEPPPRVGGYSDRMKASLDKLDEALLGTSASAGGLDAARAMGINASNLANTFEERVAEAMGMKELSRKAIKGARGSRAAKGWVRKLAEDAATGAGAAGVANLIPGGLVGGFVAFRVGERLIRSVIDRVGGVAASIDRSSGKLAAAIERSLKGKAGAAATAGTVMRTSYREDGKSTRDFQKKIKDLKELMGSPKRVEKILDARNGELRAVHPELAKSVSDSAMAKLSYLHQKAVLLNKEEALLRSERTPPTNMKDRLRWERDEVLVHQPETILDMIANGSVTPRDVEVLERANPAVLDAIRTWAIDNREKLEEAPEGVQRGYSILLGVPLTQSSDPTYVARQQDRIHQLSEEDKAEASGGSQVQANPTPSGVGGLVPIMPTAGVVMARPAAPTGPNQGFQNQNPQ